MNKVIGKETHIEDYSWIEIPEIPKDTSCLEMIRYILKNTEYWLEEEETRINFKWNKLEGNVLVYRRDKVNYETILEELESTLESIEEIEERNGKEEWYHFLYRNLYEILKEWEWCTEYIES